MFSDGKIYFAKTGGTLFEKLYLLPKMANRHGFICGATGTGKTVTLKVLAESFSQMGVPVFLADVKGDLSGMIAPGAEIEDMKKRIETFGLSADGFSFQAFPSVFFDIFGKKGIPLRTTVSEMGPQLMATILDLNDTQSDILSVVYKIADDENLLLCDTKDLKAILQYAAEKADEYELEYGRIAKQSISAIVRAIVALEAEGGDLFFGEPALNVADFFTTDISGKGMINILDSSSLINQPRLYSAFMLYLLSELFEIMPEIGDPEKPRIVFFFDEAHLLFQSASPALMEKIEQMIRMIRSKGIGVFFITQSPGDIPDSIGAQLGNKIEHALRAYTPAERKSLKAAAEAFRENPEFDTLELLSSLGTGEAIVSTLDEKGVPGIAQHAHILPPESRMGMITDEERANSIKLSNLYLKYNTPTDPDSAFEFMERRKQQLEETEAQLQAKQAEEKARLKAEKEAEKEHLKAEQQAEREREKAEKEAERERQKAEKEAEKERLRAEKEAEKAAERERKAVERSIKSVASTAAGSIGREAGHLFGKKLGGSFGKTLGGNIGASLGRNILGTLFKH